MGTLACFTRTWDSADAGGVEQGLAVEEIWFHAPSLRLIDGLRRHVDLGELLDRAMDKVRVNIDLYTQ